ncbi:MAG: carbohydrate ABC transporter permease, partial [Clostridiales bacterium]|nr:carbohydrate ABC transporter permease [Clostridiales bacterium]
YTFLSTGSKFPISVGLRYMITQTTINYSGLAAGAVIALLPPLCLFGYVQRYLVSGMSAGALKG